MITRLKRLFRRQERMHKRPFVTAITVFVVFLLAASFLFISLGILRMDSDYPQVHASSDTRGMNASGVGVNLSYIPSTNLVWDPSFENDFSGHVFSIAEASGNAIYLHGDSRDRADAVDAYYNGGSVSVISYNADGSMSQVLDASVVDYRTNQIGIWKPIENNGLLSSGSEKILEGNGICYAVLKNGALAVDAASTNPTILVPATAEDPFVGAFSTVARDFAVTRSGVFYCGSGGKNWTVVAPELEENVEICAVTAVGKIGIACGLKGVVYVCDANRVYSVDLGVTDDFVCAVSDGSVAILLTKSGVAYATSNGTVFRRLTLTELPTVNTVSWALAAYREGEFVLLGSDGEVYTGAYDAEKDSFSFNSVNAESVQGYVPKQMVVFPGGEIWMLTTDGFVYSYSRTNGTWQQSFAEQENQIEAMGISSGEDIVVFKNDQILMSSMYTKVTIDQDIGDVQLQNGDMCYLSVSVPSLQISQSPVWEIYGDNTVAQIVSDAPKAYGEKSLHLVSSASDENQEHFISQVISRDEIAPMQEKVFYHIRFYAKQSKVEGGRVMAWISGLSDPIGTTFTEVSGNWREYSFTFAWPKSTSLQEESELRLNIGFYGAGEIYADGIRLEREAYSETQIDTRLTKLLETASPEYIRLENLGLGSLGCDISSNVMVLGNENVVLNSDGTVVSSGVVSLEDSMRLVKSSNSNPWLVLDSALRQQDVDILLSYLCGGITEEYGKLRVDHGTALPWIRQFDKVVFEILDDNGLFETDLQREAYVNQVISLITNSRYYNDIKDQVIFLDGMHYEGGTMTSKADFHSSPLAISNLSAEQDRILTDDLSLMVGNAYADYSDAIPRVPAYSQESGEWISKLSVRAVSLRISENQVILLDRALNSAEILQCLLTDLGNHSSFVAVDLPVSRLDGDADDTCFFSGDDDILENRVTTSKNSEKILKTVGALQKVSSGRSVETSWVAPLSKTNDKDYSIELVSYAFYDDGNLYLIVMNPSDKQQQFLIESDTPVRDMTVERYSDSGKKISVASTASLLRLNEKRYTLQSGQFCVAVIPTEKD
ncbi:MAG: hypothetical protein J6Y08_05950 [Clostridiales bacterium]|nr:hypothetical protein [Clostridiales bacterium]